MCVYILVLTFGFVLWPLQGRGRRRPAANKSLKLRKQLSMERTWPGSTQICLPLGGRYLEHKPSQILMQELAQTKRSSCTRLVLSLSLSLYLSLSLRVESAAQSGDLQVIAFLMPANGQTVECINDSANMNMAEKGHINAIYYTISYIEYIHISYIEYI